ncbi:MAG: FAD-dependent oxidoreductase [Cyanobacteria bacterium P01_F01_bin.143]
MNNNTQLRESNTNNSSCLVIGGGISGLIASQVLQRHGIKVTVLDKGRGIGGRLATRRVNVPEYGQGIFDYGAQHFQVTDPKFQQLVDDWMQVGLVEKWTDGFFDAEGSFQKSDKAFYRGITSNRSIAKYLAKDLNVLTQQKIVELKWLDNQWIANSQQGDSFQGKNLLITAPVPQSLDLLDNSDIKIPVQTRASLEKLTYHRCIAVLAILKKPSKIRETGGLWLDGHPVSWICSNYKKGISPEAYAVTIHGSPEFSLENWEIDRDLAGKKLIDAVQNWLGSEVAHYQVHGWKFSQPIISYGASYVEIKEPGNLFFAGDAFSSQRNIEGAVLSGFAVAEHIVSSTIGIP